MKTTLVLVLLATSLLAPAATAGFDTFPVCKDKDFRAAGVWVHVGVDCYPGVWVEVCKPTGGCARYDVGDLLA